MPQTNSAIEKPLFPSDIALYKTLEGSSLYDEHEWRELISRNVKGDNGTFEKEGTWSIEELVAFHENKEVYLVRRPRQSLFEALSAIERTHHANTDLMRFLEEHEISRMEIERRPSPKNNPTTLNRTRGQDWISYYASNLTKADRKELDLPDIGNIDVSEVLGLLHNSKKWDWQTLIQRAYEGVRTTRGKALAMKIIDRNAGMFSDVAAYGNIAEAERYRRIYAQKNGAEYEQASIALFQKRQFAWIEQFLNGGAPIKADFVKGLAQSKRYFKDKDSFRLHELIDYFLGDEVQENAARGLYRSLESFSKTNAQIIDTGTLDYFKSRLDQKYGIQPPPAVVVTPPVVTKIDISTLRSEKENLESAITNLRENYDIQRAKPSHSAMLDMQFNDLHAKAVFASNLAQEAIQDANSANDISYCRTNIAELIESIKTFILPPAIDRIDKSDATITLAGRGHIDGRYIEKVIDAYGHGLREIGFEVKKTKLANQQYRLEVKGNGAYRWLKHEAEIHTFFYQDGRVHTSPVKAYVNAILPEQAITLEGREIRREYFGGSTRGGQAANTGNNNVRLTDMETGITAVQRGPSQTINENRASVDLLDKLRKHYLTQTDIATESGQPAQRIVRQYRIHNNQVNATFKRAGPQGPEDYKLEMRWDRDLSRRMNEFVYASHGIFFKC